VERKMNIQIISKKVEKLSKKEINFMNDCRIKEYGKGSSVDFKKEDSKGELIFVKDNNKIVAFGMLKPVILKFLNKKYTILAMGRGMSVIKGKEYGRILQAVRIYYIKKAGKTSIAFTDKKNIKFYEKAGFKIVKNFTERFRYKDPITGEIVKDDEDGEEPGDGVFYEGKDKLITKMLSNKSPAYVDGQTW
jgi:hypothetical protein